MKITYSIIVLGARLENDGLMPSGRYVTLADGKSPVVFGSEMDAAAHIQNTLPPAAYTIIKIYSKS